MRVRISSEAAGEISMTAVVAREMAPRELVEVILGVCGRDEARILELLQRGTVVESASRFRWDPFDMEPAALRSLLATFPESDPSRPFDAGRCMRAWLCGPRSRIELSRPVAASKRLFKRRSFWDVLMEAVRPVYVEYSYRESADIFRSAVDPASIHEAAGLLKYSGLAQQVMKSPVETVELVVTRQGPSGNR